MDVNSLISITSADVDNLNITFVDNYFENIKFSMDIPMIDLRG